MSFQRDFLKVLILKNNDLTPRAKKFEKLWRDWFFHYSFEEFDLRMNVYADSIFSTFERSLRRIFRPFIVLLGEESAHQLFRAYAEKNISRHFDLNTYGKDFGKFIKKNVPWFSDYPYLLDFADFCWHWHQVFLQFEQDIIFKSKFPVYEIWKRCQPEFKGELALGETTQQDFDYLLSKKNQKIYVIPLHQSKIRS